MTTGELHQTTKTPAKKAENDTIPSLEERIAAMNNRTPEEIEEVRKRVFAVSRPARPLPPGKTLEDVIVGALPDDESEEDIRAALADL